MAVRSSGVSHAVPCCTTSPIFASRVKVQTLGSTANAACYFVLIALSGERKSAADNWAMGGVNRTVLELRKEYTQVLREHEQAVGSLERGKDKPPRPVCPNFLVTEPTIEGAFKAIGSQAGFLGWFTDEAATFWGGHSISKEKQALGPATEPSRGQPHPRASRGLGQRAPRPGQRGHRGIGKPESSKSEIVENGSSNSPDRILIQVIPHLPQPCKTQPRPRSHPTIAGLRGVVSVLGWCRLMGQEDQAPTAVTAEVANGGSALPD